MKNNHKIEEACEPVICFICENEKCHKRMKDAPEVA